MSSPPVTPPTISKQEKHMMSNIMHAREYKNITKLSIKTTVIILI